MRYKNSRQLLVAEVRNPRANFTYTKSPTYLRREQVYYDVKLTEIRRGTKLRRGETGSMFSKDFMFRKIENEYRK